MGVVDRSQERGLIRIGHIPCTGAFLAFRRRRTTQRITIAESFNRLARTWVTRTLNPGKACIKPTLAVVLIKQTADHRVGQ